MRHHVLWSLFVAVVTAELQTVHQWKYMDFLWDTEEQRLEAARSGEYNYTRVIPSDVAVAKGRSSLHHVRWELFFIVNDVLGCRRVFNGRCEVSGLADKREIV